MLVLRNLKALSVATKFTEFSVRTIMELYPKAQPAVTKFTEFSVTTIMVLS